MPWAKLAASGETFQKLASTIAVAATGIGRQRRSESVRMQIGMAAKRIRAMFSPTAEGRPYAIRHAAR